MKYTSVIKSILNTPSLLQFHTIVSLEFLLIYYRNKRTKMARKGGDFRVYNTKIPLLRALLGIFFA